MILWKTIDVGDTQKVFVFRREQLERVLTPGRHTVSMWNGPLRFETYTVTEPSFDRVNAKFMLAKYDSILSDHIEKFELSDTEVGLYYRDNHLVDILAPGSLKFVWRGIEDIRVDVIDISESFEINDRFLGLLGRGLKIGTSRAAHAIHYVEIPDENVGMLMVNGKFQKLLDPGSYGYWKYNRSITVKQLDMRLQSIEVSGQEILTKDRVSLRINLAASFKVIKPLKVALKLQDYIGFIYRELQFSLREAVGTQALDELLEAKDTLNAVIADGVREKLFEYGVELVSVGVKDIILPGEMKMILNQVVEAQKEAEANLIKRREETQAMRSLHNTAKVMENNPTLMRLKELEALERVTSRIDNLTVYGGLEGVMHNLVKLAPQTK